MQLEQLAPYVPFGVAIIGVLGIVIGARVIKPASYTEVWAENRSLRTELIATREEIAALRREFETYKEERRSATETHDRERAEAHRHLLIVADGLDAAALYVEVLCTALRTHGIPIPEPSDAVRDLMDRAHAIRLNL